MSEGPGSYFLNRSVVVHFANKTRITCANFAPITNATTTTTTTTSAYQISSTPTPTQINNNGSPTAGGNVLTVKNFALPIVAVAMFFAL
jgi:hypothetical protein